MKKCDPFSPLSECFFIFSCYTSINICVCVCFVHITLNLIMLTTIQLFTVDTRNIWRLWSVLFSLTAKKGKKGQKHQQNRYQFCRLLLYLPDDHGQILKLCLMLASQWKGLICLVFHRGQITLKCSLFLNSSRLPMALAGLQRLEKEGLGVSIWARSSPLKTRLKRFKLLSSSLADGVYR